MVNSARFLMHSNATVKIAENLTFRGHLEMDRKVRSSPIRPATKKHSLRLLDQGGVLQVESETSHRASKQSRGAAPPAEGSKGDSMLGCEVHKVRESPISIEKLPRAHARFAINSGFYC